MDYATAIIGDIEIGKTVTGFYDNNVPVIMIYPPQHLAYALVVHGEDMPRVAFARFCEEWVSYDQMHRLRITDDTEIIMQDGTPFEGEKDELIGRLLLVKFDISHRDIPETIFAKHITVLFERIVALPDDGYYGIVPPIGELTWWDLVTLHLNYVESIDPMYAEVVIIIGENAFGIPSAKLATVGDSISPNYVPLRVVTEFLGFEPIWNDATREVTVGSPRGEITMRIGSTEYIVATESGITSTHTLGAPVIINDRTYVPLAFFREVFGFNNAWWSGGNATLDNAEIME